MSSFTFFDKVTNVTANSVSLTFLWNSFSVPHRVLYEDHGHGEFVPEDEEDDLEEEEWSDEPDELSEIEEEEMDLEDEMNQ